MLNAKMNYYSALAWGINTGLLDAVHRCFTHVNDAKMLFTTAWKKGFMPASAER
jgi:hypothetical protein